MRALFLLSFAALLTCACGSKGKGVPPERYCPGAAGCERGPDGTVKVGIAAIKITPSFEQPRLELLQKTGPGCPEGARVAADGKVHCGPLVNGSSNYFRDCGRDQLCPGDLGYTAPDADGSEGDAVRPLQVDDTTPGEVAFEGTRGLLVDLRPRRVGDRGQLAMQIIHAGNLL